MLAKQLADPDDDFVRLLASQAFSGRLTKAVREQFVHIIRDASSELIRERVQQRLREALSRAAGDEVVASDGSPTSTEDAEDDIDTTAEELQGFYIVKGILRQVVDASRIVYRDVRSYFGVLLDDNNRKPLARLHFNGRQKYIGLFDNADKKEERVALTGLDDIYLYADRLRGTVGFYETSEAPDEGQPLR